MVEGRSSAGFGAGPADLIVASTLLHDGIPVRIIDGDQNPCRYLTARYRNHDVPDMHTIRGLIECTIRPRSLELFDSLDVPEVNQRSGETAPVALLFCEDGHWATFIRAVRRGRYCSPILGISLKILLEDSISPCTENAFLLPRYCCLFCIVSACMNEDQTCKATEDCCTALTCAYNKVSMSKSLRDQY